MKRLIAVGLMIAFGLTLTTAVFAAWNRGPWVNSGEQTDVNAFRNFQKESLPLRDEMAVKRLELRNEFNKDTPDQAKIDVLQKEIIDLRTKISDTAKKNGLPDWGYGSGYGRGGYDPGNGRGYCPMWQ